MSEFSNGQRRLDRKADSMGNSDAEPARLDSGRLIEQHMTAPEAAKPINASMPAAALNPAPRAELSLFGRMRRATRLSAQTGLSGLGQVLFSSRPAAGALFLGGIALNSPLMATGAVAGIAAGTFAARALGYSEGKIREGIFGFNAALVGIATFVRFAPSVESFAALAVGSVVSTVIMERMSRRSLPPRTAPFVLTTWGLWAAGSLLGFKPAAAAQSNLFGPILNIVPDVFGSLNGLGQVMFQGATLTGAAFLAGMLLTSRRLGLFAAAGSLAGGVLGTLCGASPEAVATGLLGYNSALGAAAFEDKKTAAVSAAMTLPLYAAFILVGVPALTAPFVLATWIAPRLLRPSA